MATQQIDNVTWQINSREKVRREKMAMAKENDLIPRGKKGSMNETANFDKEDKRKNFTEGEY